MDNFIRNLVDSEFLKSRNRFQTNKSRTKRKMLSDDIKFNADITIFSIEDNSLLSLENSTISENSQFSFNDDNDSIESKDESFTNKNFFLFRFKYFG